ncbi:MAG: hypothetical protein Q9169_007168, partial [Polycauliona sp. 2 TL-2023]
MIDVPLDGGNRHIGIGLFETDGEQYGHYDMLRPLGYRDTNGFVICFAVGGPKSFESVLRRWVPEISRYKEKNVPIFLLGLKQDLRDDEATMEEYLKTGKRAVSSEEAEEVRKKISAVAYLECSAKTGHGVQEAFETMVTCLLEDGKANRGFKKGRRKFS